LTGAWGVSSVEGYPQTIKWFEWWDIEDDDDDDVVCPYCGSNLLHHFKNGISIYPELGRNAFACKNCRGLFGVE
jgi:hypothetical protein